MLFKQIGKRIKHNEHTTWHLVDRYEDIYATWSEYNKCYRARVTWTRADADGFEEEVTKEYLKTDGDLQNSEVKGNWYQDETHGGYYDTSGHFVLCEEYGLTDADTDKYAVDVMNGNGYYDADGKYRSYGKET